MAEHLHQQPLYSGALVSIRDVRCRPTDCACSGEESSPSDDLVFPRAGVFVWHVAREKVVADRNHVLFFSSSQPYRVSHPVLGGDDCTCFTFRHDILLEALARHEPGVRDRATAPFGITHGPIEPRSAYLQQRLRLQLRMQPHDPIAVEEAAFALLHEVLDGAHRVRGQRPARMPGTRRAHRERAEATKAFLANAFRTPLTLGAIARAVHTSPYHLARLFRREVGTPVHQYVTRLRLGLALEHLTNGAEDLTALALDLGYSSHSHFTESFRRAFGASPSEFRRLRQLSKNPKV